MDPFQDVMGDKRGAGRPREAPDVRVVELDSGSGPTPMFGSAAVSPSPSLARQMVTGAGMAMTSPSVAIPPSPRQRKSWGRRWGKPR